MEPIKLEFVIKGGIDRELSKVKGALKGVGTEGYSSFKKIQGESNNLFRTLEQDARSRGVNLQNILYGSRQNSLGILRSMASEITSFDIFGGVAVSAAVAFAAAAKEAYGFSKKYDGAMREVATISQTVSENFQRYKNDIIGLSTDIPVAGDAAAKALYQIVSASHDGADGMKVLEVSAKTAVGGITETSVAADAITTILNAYKLSAADAERVSDKLFTTAKLGKTTIGQMGHSLAQAAPIAAAYGVKMDELLAAVASLTKQGTPTAQAMTQIRAAILGASKVLGDGAFEGRTFQEALNEVASRAQGSEARLRELVPEVEAVNTVLSMTGKNARGTASDLESLKNSAGATQKAYEEMMQGADQQLQLLKNNITAYLLPLGDVMLEKVSQIAKSANEAFDSGDMERSLKTLSDMVKLATGALVSYKAAVIAVTLYENLRHKSLVLNRAATMAHVTATNLLIGSLKRQAAASLAAAKAALLNPYTLLATAIFAAGTALYMYATRATAAEKATEAYNKRVKEMAENTQNLKNETEQLITVLRNTDESADAKVKAYRRLQDLYKDVLSDMSLEAFLALKAADANDLLTRSIIRKNEAANRQHVNDLESEYARNDSRIRQIDGKRWMDTSLTEAIEVRRLRERNEAVAIELEKSKALVVQDIKDRTQAEYLKQELAEKAAAEEKKQRTQYVTKEQVENRKKLKSLILEIERKTNAEGTALMEEGKKKRLALAEREYEERLAGIEKDRQAYKEAWQKSGLAEDKKVTRQLDEREKIAKKQYMKDVSDIEKESAKEMNAVWDEVNSHFSSSLDNRLKEIDKFYDEAIKKAKEKGAEMSVIERLDTSRNREKEGAKNEYKLQKLDFAEEEEARRREISLSSINDEEYAEKERFEIFKKYTLQRIEILNNLGTEEAKHEAALLESAIKAGEKSSKPKTLKGIVNEKALTALKKHFQELGSSEEEATEKAENFASVYQDKMALVSDVTDALRDTFGGISEELDIALEAVGNIAKGFAEGGLIGGISAAAGQLISVVGSLFTAKRQIDKSMVEGYEDYMDAINKLIDTQIALLDKLGDKAFGENVVKTTQDIYKQIEASKTLFNESLRAGSGMFSHSDGYKANKMLKGYKKELREIGIYQTDISRMSKEQLISLRQLPEVWARIPEGMRKYLEDLAEGYDKLEEFKQQVQDTVLGFDFTSITDTIVDSLTDPSIDNALEDLSSNMDETIAAIVKNMLKRNMLAGPIEKMVQTLYKSMETGEKDSNGNPTYKLTEGAAKNFKNGVLNLGEQFSAAWKTLEEAFGREGINLVPENEKESSRTAAAKGITASLTQDSVNELNGNFNSQLMYLSKTAEEIALIREELLLFKDIQVKGWENVRLIKDLITDIKGYIDRITSSSEKIEEHTEDMADRMDEIKRNGIYLKS